MIYLIGVAIALCILIIDSLMKFGKDYNWQTLLGNIIGSSLSWLVVVFFVLEKILSKK